MVCVSLLRFLAARLERVPQGFLVRPELADESRAAEDVPGFRVGPRAGDEAAGSVIDIVHVQDFELHASSVFVKVMAFGVALTRRWSGPMPLFVLALVFDELLFAFRGFFLGCQDLLFGA